jgi:hypothetical protein
MMCSAVYIFTQSYGGGRRIVSASPDRLKPLLDFVSTTQKLLPTRADFPAFVQVSSTRSGTLKVTSLGNRLKVQEEFVDIGGSGLNTFLFGYELKGIPILRSFSGGFTKHSVILNRVIRVDYIPFEQAIQSIKLDCAVLVPGIDKTP